MNKLSHTYDRGKRLVREIAGSFGADVSDGRHAVLLRAELAKVGYSEAEASHLVREVLFPETEAEIER